MLTSLSLLDGNLSADSQDETQNLCQERSLISANVPWAPMRHSLNLEGEGVGGEWGGIGAFSGRAPRRALQGLPGTQAPDLTPQSPALQVEGPALLAPVATSDLALSGSASPPRSACTSGRPGGACHPPPPLDLGHMNKGHRGSWETEGGSMR